MDGLSKPDRSLFLLVGVLVAGILLSGLTFAILRHLEDRNAKAAFDGVAMERLDAMQTSVTLTLNSLVALDAFYDSSVNISRAGFSRFAAVLEKETNGIQALEWIPRVTKPRRTSYEKAGRHDGFPSFQLTERLAQGTMIRAGARAEYFPVYYVEPLKGNELALGYDLASSPPREEALERAAGSGQMVATSRIILVQETVGQYGFLVFSPIYRGNFDPLPPEDRRKELQGFALGVFRVADIVAKAGFTSGTLSGLRVAVFDRDAAKGQQVLYPQDDQLDKAGDVSGRFRKARVIQVGGRHWEVVVSPLPQAFRPVHIGSWLVLACGLLLTFLLADYLRLSHNRTQELREQIMAKDRAHAELKEAQKRLIEVSRLSGMAEVATGVLHNVGNVLNSINVGANLLMDRLRTSRVSRLQEVSQMLLKNQTCIGDFLTQDPRGAQILPYLADLSEHLLQERDEMGQELSSLVQHVGHVKEIVAMQQGYARSTGILEKVTPASLLEDALDIARPGMERHGIELVKEIDPITSMVTDRHQVLQILLNLVRNAKDAIKAGGNSPRRITVRLCRAEGERVRFQVADNGMGIAPQNLTRIFSHGFTTKQNGHGFGLQSGALAARQLGGSLTVASEGQGCGATFTLELPLRAQSNDRSESDDDECGKLEFSPAYSGR